VGVENASDGRLIASPPCTEHEVFLERKAPAMPSLETALLDLNGLESLARKTTSLHRLDPRTKALTTLAYMVTVVSFDKYDLSGLLPLVAYPVVLMSAGNLPAGALRGQVVGAAPVAVLLRIFNPRLDREILAQVGPFHLSGGWISCFSILLRFCFTLLAALILIATTGFNGVCLALNRLHVPQALTIQLMLLYRYLFVLAQEASRLFAAWSLRSVEGGRMPLRVFGSLSGQWLLRALDRAERVHLAMLSRGFDGTIHPLRQLRLGGADLAFALAWIAFFLLARFCNLPNLLGRVAMGAFP
jgi:cobalt/nickel transport system permease protein